MRTWFFKFSIQIHSERKSGSSLKIEYVFNISNKRMNLYMWHTPDQILYRRRVKCYQQKSVTKTSRLQARWNAEKTSYLASAD